LSTIERPVPAEFLERVIGESQKLTAAVWKEVFAGLAAYEAAEPAITCATLVLGGDTDAVFAVGEQEALARAITGARITIVPGVGHALHWEDPERFAKELAAFLAHLPRT